MHLRQIADRIALSPDDVRSLDARDFRHAATTDAAGKSNEIEGIAYTLGHKDCEPLRATSTPTADPLVGSSRHVLRWEFGMGCPISDRTSLPTIRVLPER